MSLDENKKIKFDDDLMQTASIDQPLLVVLDEDDYTDGFESFDITEPNPTEISPKGDELNIEVKNLIESLSIEPAAKLQVFHRPSNELKQSKKFIRTIVIDSSFKRRTNHQRSKSLAKRKTMSASKNRKPLTINDHSFDSILSFISFDKVSDILTISRMGSIYYCIEDLYIKVFSSLCTLYEFTNFLVESESIILKQVTLSEKISIELRSPKLKKLNHIRYRLISINSSDYLIKLKHLLFANKKGKRVEKIIDEMRGYKQTSAPILSNKKISTSTKRISVDGDDEHHKRLRIVTNEPTQSHAFIRCNVPINCHTLLTNAAISSPTTSEIPLVKEKDHANGFASEQSLNNNLTQCSFSSLQNNPSDFSITENSFSISSSQSRRLRRSNSSTFDRKQIKKVSSRSSSLPLIKFNLKDKTMLTLQPAISGSVGDNCSMPMIVNVEENVEVNNEKGYEQYRSYSQRTFTSQMTTPLTSTKPSTSTVYSYLHPPPSRSPYNPYYQESTPLSYSHKKFKESPSSNTSDSNSFSSITTPFSRNPNVCHLITSDPQTSSIPYCSHSQTMNENGSFQSQAAIGFGPNGKVIYRRKYTKCTDRPTSQKQRQTETTPYPSSTTLVSPLSTHYPHLSNRLINVTARKTDAHRSTSSTFISPPNTPNELSLPNMGTRSISLSLAITLRGNCDMDRIPKLVVRHSKTYSNKTIDTMGQLFPTWFNEPDYRCVHCFTCDQVFTPQQFMIHVDDEQLANEQIINMTSIQLLTSEKMSENKVTLWNQFCTALAIYAREGRITGFASIIPF